MTLREAAQQALEVVTRFTTITADDGDDFMVGYPDAMVVRTEVTVADLRAAHEAQSARRASWEAADMQCAAAANAIESLRAEVDALREENKRMRPWFKPALCEALQRDAERYRWLRDHGTALDPDLWGDALDEAIDAALSETCTWAQDDEGAMWETECEQLFDIIDGTPSDNQMEFCCYCGKPIDQQEYVEQCDDAD